MIKVLIPVIYATVLFILPRRIAVAARHKIADLVFYQWSKSGKFSAFLYAWLEDDGKVENLSPYLDEYHHGKDSD